MIYIKHKFRLLTIIILLMLLNLGINIVSYSYEEMNSYYGVSIKNEETDYLLVTVNSGDTLWNIVKENYFEIDKPEYMDIRDVIHVVSDINDGPDIQVGQVIKIPRIIK